MTRVGVAIMPEVNPATDDRWRRAEQYGFAHAWSFDHLAWRTLADSPWHATVPTLAAAILNTSTIPVGTFVASPSFRHPVPFSKELMTLDVMSGGRLNVAIGAGAPGYDASMLGGPEMTAAGRHRRFEEFVTGLDMALRNPVSSWAGEFYTGVDVRTIPGPAQRPRPPFILASNGPRGMRLAATLAEGWATMGTADRGSAPEIWWRGVADAAHRFDDVLGTVQASVPGYRRFLDVMSRAGPVSSVEKLREDAGRAGELGFTDIVVAWPRRDEPFAGSEEIFEAFGALLREGAVTG